MSELLERLAPKLKTGKFANNDKAACPPGGGIRKRRFAVSLRHNGSQRNTITTSEGCAGSKAHSPRSSRG